MARSHEFSGPGFNITRRGPRGLRGLAHTQIATARENPTPETLTAAETAVAAAGTSKKSRDARSGIRNEGSGFGNALRKIQARAHGYILESRSFPIISPGKDNVEPSSAREPSLREQPGNRPMPRTPSGQIAPFTRGDELLGYTRDHIASSQEDTLDPFPTTRDIASRFGTNPNTVARVWREAELTDEVSTARRRVERRLLDFRDDWVAATYENIVFDLEHENRSAHPTLATFADEVGVEEAMATRILRSAGLLVDFRRRVRVSEGVESSSRDRDDHSLQAKREKEQEKREKQDETIKAFLTSSLGAIIIGEQETLESNIQIGEALDIHRNQVADSLRRLGLSEFVNEVRRVLSKKGQAGRALEQALEAAHEDPRTGVASHTEIGRNLGINRSVVSKAAKEKGLNEQLSEAKEQANDKEIIPSQQTAQLLGMLVGAGTVEMLHGVPSRIAFSSRDAEVLDAFQKAGERIFGIRGYRKQRRSTTTVTFHSTIYAAVLGQLRRSEAYKIRKANEWLMSPTYIKKFASGVFDARGKLAVYDTRAELAFYTSSENNAKLYREVLIALGIHSALIEREGEAEQVRGVRINNLKDLKKYASQIESVIPTEQDKLNRIKEMQPQKRVVKPRLTRQEIIDAWNQVAEEKGGRPTSNDIRTRRGRTEEKIKTVLTLDAIINEFGGETGSFAVAADELEAIRLSPPKEQL